jgi:hypothetical protein
LVQLRSNYHSRESIVVCAVGRANVIFIGILGS